MPVEDRMKVFIVDRNENKVRPVGILQPTDQGDVVQIGYLPPFEKGDMVDHKDEPKNDTYAECPFALKPTVNAHSYLAP
jgi:hypothetical protein